MSRSRASKLWCPHQGLLLQPFRGLKDLAAKSGIYLVDHELVTLLRHFGLPPVNDTAPPRIVCPLALQSVS